MGDIYHVMANGAATTFAAAKVGGVGGATAGVFTTDHSVNLAAANQGWGSGESAPAKFGAGDTLLFYPDAPYGRLRPTKGGTAVGQVIYQGVNDGGLPELTGVNTIIVDAGLNYMTFKDFTLTPTSIRDCVNIGQTSTGIQLLGLTGACTSQGRCIFCSGKQINMLIQDCAFTITNTNPSYSAYGVFFYNTDGLNPSTNLTIRNLSIDGAVDADAITLQRVNGLTIEPSPNFPDNPAISISNVIRVGANCHGLNCTYCTGDLNMSNTSFTRISGSAIRVDGSSFSSAAIDNFSASRIGAAVVVLVDQHDYAITNLFCNTSTAGQLFAISGNSYNMDISKFVGIRLGSDCLSTYGGSDEVACHDIIFHDGMLFMSGDRGDSASGDAMTTHYSDYDIIFDNIIVIGSTGSGAALVGKSSGEVKNCVFLCVGEAWATMGIPGAADAARALIYVPTDDVNPHAEAQFDRWHIHDNIIIGGYPFMVGMLPTSPYVMYRNRYMPYMPVHEATIDEDYETAFAKIHSFASSGGLMDWDTYKSREPDSTCEEFGGKNLITILGYMTKLLPPAAMTGGLG